MSQTVLITGANRGIGLGLAEKYASEGWRVIAACRNLDAANDLNALQTRFSEMVQIEDLDVGNPDSIARLGDKLFDTPIDVIVNNAGAFGPKDEAATDLHKRLSGQFFGDIDYDAWEETLRVNAFGPLRMAEALKPSLLKGEGKKFIYISSSAASITGGLQFDSPVQLFVYPSSKALGNKVMATLSKVFAPDGIAVACLCPGHVKTSLGGPQASMTVEESANGLFNIIEDLSMETTGRFTRHNGENIDW